MTNHDGTVTVSGSAVQDRPGGLEDAGHASRQTSSPSQRHLFWLDWFRFAAAFDVMASHTRGINWVHYEQMTGKSSLVWAFFTVTHLGEESVILFFALSGFLVGGKILERCIDGSFDLRAYILDRVSRIYVPLVPTLLICGIFWHPIGRQLGWFLTFLVNVAGLQIVCNNFCGGNGPVWSISYEIWFYVLGGLFAVLVCGRGWAKVISLCGIMFVLALFTRMEAPLLFCWCLGACGYLLISADISAMAFCGGVALAVFGFTFTVYMSGHSDAFGSSPTSWRVPELIFCLGLAIVFAFVSKRPPVWRPILAFEKVGAKLAAFSYTLYLTHSPVLSVWEKFRVTRYSTFGPRSILWFFIEIGSCLLFAFVFYLAFEAQTPRVRGWLKRSIPAVSFSRSR